jgi:hypothetical protein
VHPVAGDFCMQNEQRSRSKGGHYPKSQTRVST